MKFVLSLAATVLVRAEDPMLSMANMAIDNLSADYAQKQGLKKVVKEAFKFKAVIETGDCAKLQKESRKLLNNFHDGVGNAVSALLSMGQMDTQMKAFVEMGKRVALPYIKLQGNDFIDNQLCEFAMGATQDSDEGHEEF